MASAICVFEMYMVLDAQALDFVDVFGKSLASLAVYLHKIFMVVDFMRLPLVWFSL